MNETVIWKFLGSVNFGSMLFNGPFSLRTVILGQEIFVWKRTLYDRIRMARDLDLDLIQSSLLTPFQNLF